MDERKLFPDAQDSQRAVASLPRRRQESNDSSKAWLLALCVSNYAMCPCVPTMQSPTVCGLPILSGIGGGQGPAIQALGRAAKGTVFKNRLKTRGGRQAGSAGHPGRVTRS